MVHAAWRGARYPASRQRKRVGRHEMNPLGQVRGDVVTFDTNQVPGGRVTDVPPVTARRTAEGLAFLGDVAGWAVPHDFVMRRVE